jgi:hypothetical protein
MDEERGRKEGVLGSPRVTPASTVAQHEVDGQRATATIRARTRVRGVVSRCGSTQGRKRGGGLYASRPAMASGRHGGRGRG